MNYIFSYFSTEEIILLAAVFCLFVFEWVYWYRVFGRVAFYKAAQQPRTTGQQPVSIILSARNEYEVLRKNLPAILTQDYPEFEVVVVNDGSDDDTEILLASMQGQYPKLAFRTIVKDEKFRHNKKMALGMGIKAAKYDLLLFIDADCRPAGDKWLQSIQQYFVEKKSVVIGYTRLANTPKWICADHFMQALHAFGQALLRKPYMGVNSNLAYRKQLFFDNKGFDVRITDGLREDIAFVNKVATAQNVAVALGEESITLSSLRYTPSNWRRYRIDELRSLAMSEKGPKHPALAEAFCRLLFFTSIVVAAIVFQSDYTVLLSLLGVVLVRFAANTILFTRAQKRLGETKLLPMLWLWDVLSPFYYSYLLLSSLFRTNTTWR